MLGDETIGDIALAEGDFPTVTSVPVSAVAVFAWSTTNAVFTWSEGEPSSNFGWS